MTNLVLVIGIMIIVGVFGGLSAHRFKSFNAVLDSVFLNALIVPRLAKYAIFKMGEQM